VAVRISTSRAREWLQRLSTASQMALLNAQPAANRGPDRDGHCGNE